MALTATFDRSQRVSLLDTANALLKYCPALTDTQLASRLMRAILPNLTILLAPQSEVQQAQEENVQGSKNKKGKKRAAPEPVASDAEIEVEPERRVKKSKSGTAAKTSKRATTNPAKSASNRHRRAAYKTVQDSDVVLEGDDRVSRAESDRASTTDTSLVRVLPQELPRHVSSGLQSAAHRRLSPLQGPRAPL